MKSASAQFSMATHHRHILLILFLLTSALHADQVQMQNGDRYFGKITTLNTSSLVLQSEILGTVQLPRNKVTAILLDTNLSSNITIPANKLAATATTNTVSDPSIRQLAAHSNLIAQVQNHYLADAGPEANAKFTELMAGLTSGKLNVSDLRAEARQLADQVRELKKGLSEDEISSLDTYLSILDKFLKEPASAGSPAASSAPKPQIKPDKANE